MADVNVPAPGDAVSWAYRTDLKGTAKFLLVTLALFASCDEDDRWTAWPKRRTLAVAVGVSVERVKALLRDLEKAGVVVREERQRGDGGRTASRYVLAVDPPGRPQPPPGSPATPGPGSPATPHEPTPTEPTPEPSPPGPPEGGGRPDDPREDPRLPRAVGRGQLRRPLSKSVARLAVRILDYWERRTGVAVTGQDVGRGIVLRIIEQRDAGDPPWGPLGRSDDAEAAEAGWHRRVIDANLAAPWWEGRATPAVLYGNSKAWNAAKARLLGGTVRHPDQDPTRAAAQRRDAERARRAIEEANKMEPE